MSTPIGDVWWPRVDECYDGREVHGYGSCLVSEEWPPIIWTVRKLLKLRILLVYHAPEEIEKWRAR